MTRRGGEKSLEDAGVDYEISGNNIAIDPEFVLKLGEKIVVKYTIKWEGEGSHINEANVNAVGEWSGKAVKDDDDVTVKIGGNRPPRDNTPRDNERNTDNTPTDSTEIIDPEVPLATLPEDEPMIIPDEDVPLADIPQTGLDGGIFGIGTLGMSMSALLALYVMKRREETRIEDPNEI